jgi:HSP20 family protein
MLPTYRDEWPSLDLEDKGKEFLLTAEMPGLKKDNVQLEVEDQAVEIRGSTSWNKDEKTDRYVHRERAAQSFHRRIELPEEIDTNNVRATMNDGLLELTLPKKYPKEKKKVNIR